MSSLRPSAVVTGIGGLALATHVAPYLFSTMAYGPQNTQPLQLIRPRLFGIGRPGHLALTFDDGPHPTGTPAVLQTLDELGWKATFFMIAANARRLPEIVNAVVEQGHEVALHGNTHRSFMKLSPAQATRDIARGTAVLEDLSQTRVRHFRPPYGTLSASAVLAAKRHGLTTVLWSAWGRDWSEQVSASDVCNSMLEGRLDGGTVLLHDSDSPSSPGNWAATTEALRLLVPRVAERQLKVGRLDHHGTSAIRIPKMNPSTARVMRR